MANNGTFRTALNGFNREDVAAYLESAAERYNTLKEQNELLWQNNSELEAKLREQESSRSESTGLSEQIAGQEQIIAGLRAEGDALRTENEALRRRVTELETAESENAEKAAEYDTLRQRIATLELDASRRAAEIERSAEAQAQKIRQASQEEADSFARQREAVRRAYCQSLGDAAAGTERTAKSVSEELTKIMLGLQALSESLQETADAFDPAADVPAAESGKEEG